MIELSCDSNVNGYIAGLVATETSVCRYLIQGRTAAACGVVGDPFDKPNDKYTDGDVFGFTILGAVLCVFVQFTYAFADKKGWIDPITRRCVGVAGGGGGVGWGGLTFGGVAWRSASAPRLTSKSLSPW